MGQTIHNTTMQRTMETLARDVQLKYMLDCRIDFYLPTLHKRDILQRLYQNMLDGRCDAVFMLDMENERDLMNAQDLRIDAFYHPATQTLMHITSRCQQLSLGIHGIDGNFHWFCDVATFDVALGLQDHVDCGLDEEDYVGDGMILHHFKVDTGVRPDVYYGHANTNEEIRAAKVRLITPEGLKASWIRAFPSIQRHIQKLKRCRTCKKRVQENPRCATCVMTG